MDSVPGMCSGVGRDGMVMILEGYERGLQLGPKGSV